MTDILYIDDPETELQLSDTLFRESGFKLHFASGKQNGIRIARRYVPDLIVCHLANELEGIQLLKRLLEDSLTQSIPLIYISTQSSYENQREVMRLGADDYITSPFTQDDLIQSIACRMEKQTRYRDKLMTLCRETLEAEQPKSKPDDHILVTLGNRLHLVKYKQIVCILALKEYSKLRLEDGRSIVVRKSLRSWLNQLPSRIFLRIHRSTIINATLIERIEKRKARTYVVFLKSLKEPLEFSQRYANIMRKTFPS